MSREVWVNNYREAKLQITQVQELVIDLNEHEQEMIFGSGQHHKSATLSNFRITIGELN